MNTGLAKISRCLSAAVALAIALTGCVTYVEDPDNEAGPLDPGDMGLDEFPVWEEGVDGDTDGYCDQLIECLCGAGLSEPAFAECMEWLIRNYGSLNEGRCREILENETIGCLAPLGTETKGTARTEKTSVHD